MKLLNCGKLLGCLCLLGGVTTIFAIHHHMIQENPRYLFLHYWRRGKAVDLAKAVQAALQAISK